MRRSFIASALALALALASGALALAQSDPAAGPTRAEAVAIVLESDPRYVDLADWEDLRVAASQEFRTFETLTMSSFYHVLGPTLTLYADYGFFSLSHPKSWLVEVVLVDGCVEPEIDDGELPFKDPCSWRQMMVYAVGPDGVPSLVLEHGDPEPMLEAG